LRALAQMLRLLQVALLLLLASVANASLFANFVFDASTRAIQLQWSVHAPGSKSSPFPIPFKG
jgi:hypothetical protein